MHILFEVDTPEGDIPEGDIPGEDILAEGEGYNPAAGEGTPVAVVEGSLLDHKQEELYNRKVHMYACIHII